MKRKIKWKFWKYFIKTPLDILSDEMLDSLYSQNLQDWKIRDVGSYETRIEHIASKIVITIEKRVIMGKDEYVSSILSPTKTTLPLSFGREFLHWKGLRVRFFTINDEIFLLKLFKGEFGEPDTYIDANSQDIRNWIKEHCQGCVCCRFDKIYFANKNDQMLYRLTWCGNDRQ